MFNLQWFQQPVEVAPRGAHEYEAEKRVQPRDIKGCILAHLDGFNLPVDFDLEHVLSQCCIPPHVTFGAAPISLTDHLEADRLARVTFAELFEEPLQEERHAATVADLLWLLPNLPNPPWKHKKTAFHALVYPGYARPPEGTKNQLFLFQAVTQGAVTRWGVMRSATSCQGSSTNSPSP